MKLKNMIIAFSLLASMLMAADRYEAEDGSIDGGATIANRAGASGSSLVQMKEGSISVKVTVPESKNYTILIAYTNTYGDKINTLQINGKTIGDLDFPETKSNEFKIIESVAPLKSGENTISLVKNWGWIDVDYFEISNFEASPFTINPHLVTPNATIEARKVYQFLVENFSKKTISGVMTGDLEGGPTLKEQLDVQDIFTKSQKYPAMVGFDFMFATGAEADGSWSQDYTNTSLRLAEELWEEGGIPAFTWHWRDPNRLTNEFYIEGANPEFTKFDYSDAFKPGTTEWNENSSTYKNMIADIDQIADLFLGLQAKGVAAIFRPLHEVGGEWFWWTARKKGDLHSASEFIALYRLVFDRIVHHKKVNNLIWVWNPEPSVLETWDPGAEYYDILSYDKYNNANDYSSHIAAYNSYKNASNSNKILALSENGPIPDVNNMHEDGAVWSWWMPWYASWGGEYPSRTENSVWVSNMSDPRIITLEDMPGWDAYTLNTILSKQSTPFHWALQGKHLKIQNPKNENLSVEIFHINGNKVKSFSSSPANSYSLEALPKGVYVLRIQSPSVSISKPIAIQ